MFGSKNAKTPNFYQSRNYFRLSLVILSILNYGLIQPLHSQEKKNHEQRLPGFSGKHLLGIQFNPLFTKDYDTEGYTAGIRYGYKIYDPVTVAADVTGYFFNNQVNDTGQPYDDSPGIGLGVTARYSSPARKRVQIFLELSPIYHFSFKENADTIKSKGNTIAIYMAPGFSIYSRNRKFSFDLYYKISTQSFTNERHSILAYKMNYHFK